MFSEDYRRSVCLDDQDVGLDWNALLLLLRTTMETSSALQLASTEIFLKIFTTYSRNQPPQKLNISLCSRVAQSLTQNKGSFFTISEGDCLFPSSQPSLAASSHGSTTWLLQPKKLLKNEPSVSIGSKLKKMIDFTTLKLTLRAVAYTILDYFAHKHQQYKFQTNNQIEIKLYSSLHFVIIFL